MIANVSIPADVRAAGADAVSNYKAAAGFEQLLAAQLVKAMTDNSPLGEGPYAVQMQDTLSTALVSGPGLGLARQLYKEMQS
ncbi:MAG TPA: hypothetical protein VFZ00_04805 [Solirubrobacter sp.]|nr:hypothetical protein [Solirubrobacter sp.]